MQRASGENYSRVKRLIENHHLNTICTSGNCPNKGECWNAGTATFMILGDICTRDCKFCATRKGKPLAPDPQEPFCLAEIIKELDLKHCVITSVDRDDLPDRGSSFWASTIRIVKEMNRGITVEALIPDFDGNKGHIQLVLDAGADVISHNIETVRRLTPLIRSKAKYNTSLEVLKYISGRGNRTKSGFMVGLGETGNEVNETINDLFLAGCRILTVGQYLQPTVNHMNAARYVDPSEFQRYKKFAYDVGFEIVECQPLVRSSFHSEKHVRVE